MDENKILNEVGSETINEVCEEVSKSNGNILIKVAVGIVVTLAGIGGVLFYRNRKKSKNQFHVIKSMPEDIKNDENEE